MLDPIYSSAGGQCSWTFPAPLMILNLTQCFIPLAVIQSSVVSILVSSWMHSRTQCAMIAQKSNLKNKTKKQPHWSSQDKGPPLYDNFLFFLQNQDFSDWEVLKCFPSLTCICTFIYIEFVQLHIFLCIVISVFLLQLKLRVDGKACWNYAFWNTDFPNQNGTIKSTTGLQPSGA